MNPAIRLKRILNQQDKRGVVVDVTVNSLHISVSGTIEIYPLQSGFQLNDSVVILDGRLIKSPVINILREYEV